ncbi:hypothetical protein [Spirosoma foliorum]|uniref:Lipoprotein n=1 Tax=Spirosoma foliorum TaxID=2710596 RepID=A0A7G5GQT7_9BACT|nr:hypothetical protein [Spirosoma foliorum]QMW01229.1 hypothetical protein H3H32_25110 [Spirosoma foliorum]
MKAWRLCIFLLIIGLLGCRKDETTPNDLLYRRWRMTQIQYNNGQSVDISANDAGSIVTFKANGMILYGEDGKYDPCCLPDRFNRKGNILDLIDVQNIPLPERTPNPTCALVDCAPPGNVWQIDKLTSSSLIITQERAIATYQPYP